MILVIISVLAFKIATISIYIYLNGVSFIVWIYKKDVYVYFLLDTIFPTVLPSHIGMSVPHHDIDTNFYFSIVKID